MRTIVDLLRHSAEQTPARICIRTGGADPAGAASSFTAADFYRILVSKSRLFHDQYGLQRGDTVALMADNSLEYLILVYAALCAGLSVFVISTRSLPEHLGYFLQRSGARHLFCSRDYRSVCQEVVGEGSPGFISDLAAFRPEYGQPAEQAPAAVRSLPELAPVDELDTAVILHTSGTTKTPKLVYLSHRNIISNQLASDAAFRQHWTADDVTLGWLPLYHGYALLAEFLRDMLVGSTYVLYQKAGAGQVTAETLLQALAAQRITVLCCVPWMLNLLRDRIAEEQASGNDAAERLLQQLKFIVTGGSRLGSVLGDFFRERNIRIVTMFGLSEAAGFVLHSPFDGSRWDLLLPNASTGVEFVPVDAQQREHELVLTNPALYSSKVLRPPEEATVAAASAGRLETGDLFVYEGGGWAYVGRGDQIYNGAHGEKVNPQLFELALEQHAAVQKVFVYGEELSFNVALAKLKPGCAEDSSQLDSIRHFIQHAVNPLLENPDRVYPSDVFFMGEDEDMPLTPKGSVNRKQAANMVKNRLQRRDNPVLAGVADAATVRQIFEHELLAYYSAAPGEDILSFTLLELGFDSLMTLSLRNNLQEKLKLKIPVELLLSYPPLEAFVQELCALNQQLREQGAELESADQHTSVDGWRGIALEQVIFHKAYYLFPGPTFGGSFSLVAPRQLQEQELVRGLLFLERNHEVLRSIYRPEGTFCIADYSMISRAFISHTNLTGSHDLNDNHEVQTLIQQLALQPFNFNEGPAWRYATVDITNSAGETRTMLFIGINHIIGDFRSFGLMVREFMCHIDGSLGAADVIPDAYQRAVTSGSAAQIRQQQELMQTLLTAGLDQLPKGVDLRQGTRVRFNFKSINLDQVAGILREHNLSLFNTVYALWIVAASKHVAGMSLQDFPSVTSVTTRISKELETLMGCFVYTPLYRFHLDPQDTLKTAARKVQRTTLDAFKGVLVDPVAYFGKVLADPANLIPIIKRNVFLYRSPDELIEPVPGWGCYRNDYFEDRCNVGAYFDFCANVHDRSMEGYLTVNLQFCSREVAETIVRDIEKLMLQILQHPDLGFIPSTCV